MASHFARLGLSPLPFVLLTHLDEIPAAIPQGAGDRSRTASGSDGLRLAPALPAIHRAVTVQDAAQVPQVVQPAPAGRQVGAQLLELVGYELEGLAAPPPGAGRAAAQTAALAAT